MEQVLLIECHDLLRRAILELLARCGFEQVLEAADPVEAVQHVMRRSPRMIVLDTLIPEMEGFCLSQMLRELAPHSKIVLLLENTAAPYQAAAQASGADAFIAKAALSQELPPLLARWNEIHKRGDMDGRGE